MIPTLSFRKIHGLTLIELLIATAIFSIIILSIYSAFQIGILSYHKIDSAFEVYQMARLVLNRIALDLRNTFIYAQDNSRFEGDETNMVFFSGLDSFSEGKMFLDLCRIKYSLAEEKLKRSSYKGLNALNAKDPDGESFYEVKNISFQYAYATDKPDKPYDWQTAWPKDESQKNALPQAVKIKLSLLEKDKRQEEQARVIEFNKIIALPLGENTGVTAGE